MSDTPTTITTDMAISRATSTRELIAVADHNPVVADGLSVLGQPSYAQEVQIATAIVLWLAARFGTTLDAATAATLAGALAYVAGKAWSVISRRMARAKVMA